MCLPLGHSQMSSICRSQECFVLNRLGEDEQGHQEVGEFVYFCNPLQAANVFCVGTGGWHHLSCETEAILAICINKQLWKAGYMTDALPEVTVWRRLWYVPV